MHRACASREDPGTPLRLSCFTSTRSMNIFAGNQLMGINQESDYGLLKIIDIILIFMMTAVPSTLQKYKSCACVEYTVHSKYVDLHKDITR